MVVLANLSARPAPDNVHVVPTRLNFLPRPQPGAARLAMCWMLDSAGHLVSRWDWAPPD